jgi:predicted nucleotidyltransferase
MWFPTWLGEVYAKLFSQFGLELFTFKEARSFLGFNENRLAVCFSKLHSCRVLLIFEGRKPRLYRLLDPENFILLASETVHNVDRIAQERYVKLLCDVFRSVQRTLDLSSFAVYGSVARGVAKEHSDIDVLVVSNDFSGSIGSRIDKLYDVEVKSRDELSWLRKHGVYTGLSFYPLREEEAKKIPLLFLDLTEEAVVMYDKNGFLERLLTELKTRLAKLGGRRIFIDRERWYWNLKPDYKFGEEVAI